MEPKYPNIEVWLAAEDAYRILVRVKRALRLAGISEAEIEQFRNEAMSGDCGNLLATCCRWVAVSGMGRMES